MTREIQRPASDPVAGAAESGTRPAEDAAALAATLDPNDSDSVLFFGAKVQHRLSRISRKMLAAVAEDTVGGAGQAVDEMLTVIRSFDFEGADPNVKPPWWKRWWPGARPLPRLLQAIGALRHQVERAAMRLEREKTELLADAVAAGKLDQQCSRHLDDLELHLEAARRVLGDGRGGQHPELVQRVADLTVSRQLGQQARASLLLVQQSSRELVARVNFLLANTVPAWQQHMTLLVAIWRRRKAADAIAQSRAVAEDMASARAGLRAARERVELALGEGIYDLDAISVANEELEAALVEGRRLAEQGRAARARARALLDIGGEPEMG